VLVLDAGGVVTHASRAALQLTLDDPLGRPFAQAVPLRVVDSPDRAGSRPKWLARQIGQALEGRSVSGLEVSAAGDGAERHHYLLSAGPLYDAREQVAGAVVMLTDITERKRFEQHQRVLLAELSHRVKNTLVTVQSVAAQTMRHSTSLDDFYQRFSGRLHALGRAHSLLTDRNWKSLGLHDVVVEPLRAHMGEPKRIQVRGDDLELRPSAALALGMVIHELATNATKHGALSDSSGRVEVDWGLTPAHGDRHLRLLWREYGGPELKGPAQHGFGLTLIERGVSYELQGHARLDFAPEGLTCELHIPCTRDNFDI
jgi:two-component sensor histidine kinase